MSWSRYLPSTKVVAVCDSLCDTISTKCDWYSEVPVLAISGVVDTCSISTGDGWIWVGRGFVAVTGELVVVWTSQFGPQMVDEEDVLWGWYTVTEV